MPRPAGSRNADHEQTRAQIVKVAARVLLTPQGASASFREFARAARVTPATLRHYFPDRVTLVASILATFHVQGEAFLALAAEPPPGTLRDSLLGYLRFLVEGWRQGPVGAMHTAGLQVGLGDGTLGPAYLRELLEPSLQATERRLARHIERRQIEPCDLRLAALELVAPVLLLLLHQDQLGGESVRGLDVPALLPVHVDRFMRAYAPRRERGGQSAHARDS